MEPRLEVLRDLAKQPQPHEGLNGSQANMKFVVSGLGFAETAVRARSPHTDQKNLNVAQFEPAVEAAQDPALPNPGAATAADYTGVTVNAAGDLVAWLTALVTNVIFLFGMLTATGVLRRRYPIIYSANVPDNTPFVPSESLFGWLYESLFRVQVDDVIKYAGLDQGMLIEFNRLGMSILWALGAPLVFIVGPLHCWYGGDRSGNDHLSKWGLANVVDGHPWLYWLHAALVWVVVLTVCRKIYQAQANFLVRRTKWLKSLPAPRNATILVEGIPEDHRSDEKLKAYFDRIFGRKAVKCAYTVKHTGTLCDFLAVKDDAEQKLLEAKTAFEKTGERPKMRAGALPFGESEDSITYWTEKRDEAQKEFNAELRSFKRAAGHDLDLNTPSGFVTFFKRRDAELALNTQFRSDECEFVTSTPPDPADVVYTTFQEGENTKAIKQTAGYALIVGVFIAYLPFIVLCIQLADLKRLATFVPALESMAASETTIAVWNAMVSSLAIQLFVGFLPTFLVVIFSLCFRLTAAAYMQHCIQAWYFYFQVIFIMLVTAVGTSLLDTLHLLVEEPLALFPLLATTMPFATHFYLKFIPLQWVTHGMNSTRYIQLVKFKSFGVLFDDPVAKAMSEPEDQDYYGLGSRSARHSFFLALCLVFCSLTPLITVLGFVNCLVARTIYTYLIVFAETRKPDLGGHFWVTKLRHVMQCMFLYIILMVGVLMVRGATKWPSVIASGSFIYMFYKYRRFAGTFKWEALCLEELKDVTPEDTQTTMATRHTYEQPELSDMFDAEADVNAHINARVARMTKRATMAKR